MKKDADNIFLEENVESQTGVETTILISRFNTRGLGFNAMFLDVDVVEHSILRIEPNGNQKY